ncbi:MAG: hypothetical protein LLG40_06290, partial [Deltaproteobacteria bacterium]|nr:hypothetical protein [Deltaproteobacteria bacterium]
MIEKLRKERERIENRYFRSVRRPLDRIPTDGKFIQSPKMTTAFSKQTHTGNLPGEPLVDFKTLDQAEYYNTLLVQRDFSTVEEAINAAAGARLMLGELLLTSSRITQDQLDAALEEQ